MRLPSQIFRSAAWSGVSLRLEGLGSSEGSAGQGWAFRQVGPTRVAVVTVVNAVGAIVDRQGRVVRGHLDPETGGVTTISRGWRGSWRSMRVYRTEGNTTLTVWSRTRG